MTVPARDRSGIIRDSIGIGVATGAYGISFGAIAIAAGLDVWQAQVLSGLMFTGASQFALVGVLGAGGGALVAVATAALLGLRNTFYGLHMAPILRPRGLRRLAAAQVTIDESTGMAVRYEDSDDDARLAFWSTGLAVFILWNLGTLLGALGAGLLGEPETWGLDAAIPAAFLALLWPRLTTGRIRLVALIAVVIAVALSPFLAAGIPVLLAGAGAVAIGVALQSRPERSGSPRNSDAQESPSQGDEA
jgi:predicted branched-subunit amino acid permease